MKDFFNLVEEALGYRFCESDLLELALTHRSYWNEHKEEVPGHNERLEFLGDSVLGMLVATFLYTKYPDLPEGELSDLRAQLVEARSCARYMRLLNIDEALRLGRGELLNQGKGRDSILADFFEALIGALYLDGGIHAVQSVFFSKFSDAIEALLAQPSRNWKAELQDYTQKTLHQTPTYSLLEESGPGHQKMFRVAVQLEDKVLAEGEGSSKKAAQMQAAKIALERLENE